MDQPLVTVICSTYNSKATLQFALRSVLNQSFANFEVQVIGDGCTDGSESVISTLNDPRLSWSNLPENTGSQSEPNNEGLRRARGRYVAFIGHDDLWFPWHLERLVAQVERSGADLVHDLSASVGLQGVEGVYGPPHPRSGYPRVYVPTSSWLHRRELAEEIGFWRKPDELSWAIDFDFTRRAALAGKNIQCVESLGVLKFHSAVWELYSRSGPAPAEAYWEAMIKSPDDLSEQVLTQLAARYAQESQSRDKTPFGLACSETRIAAKGALKAGMRDLLHAYGAERWPVGPLLRSRARRIRSNFRVARGLPATIHSTRQ
jgi:glycosyltransferase involved in cell wall biosynthesis